MMMLVLSYGSFFGQSSGQGKRIRKWRLLLRSLPIDYRNHVVIIYQTMIYFITAIIDEPR
jgi:hypothetical protein